MYAKGLRIVAADDDEEMRGYYSRILPALGHAALAVESNGRDLFQRAREHHPDLVITDYKMPDMTGREAVEQLDSGIPYIVVSAFDRPEDWTPEHSQTLIAYLVKPVARQDIESAIDEAARFRLRTTTPAGQ